MISGSIEVRRLTDQRDFLALESEWHGVAERCSSVSIFQTHEWQRTWWKHYGSGSMHIRWWHMPARGPLRSCRSTRARSGCHWCDPSRSQTDRRRRGHFARLPGPDRDGRVRAGSRGRVRRYLLEHRTDWDVLELTDLPASSPLREVLLSLQAARWLHRDPGGADPDPILRAAGELGAYLQSLSSHARYSVRSIRKKFVSLPEKSPVSVDGRERAWITPSMSSSGCTPCDGRAGPSTIHSRASNTTHFTGS